ncbi:cell division protein SepF [Corynebacterium aquatimens]|uniref:cell division protein SepF n=1 Tax=Corynebacterium TaxID=1716 RepID=UPI001F1F26C2|nr:MULTISPECIES: cell division protein SepF [Corynebacterium]QYH19493.1 cell division protein SepF [Corynebacterium aquatimens]UIZ91570.1 cell division protein SepF [Corynebacterium sp. CNCTC7651]
MSFIGSAKEFFGLGPYNDGDDAYYEDDQQYRDPRDTRETAHGTDRLERPARPEHVVREPRSFTPEIVSTAPRSYNDAKEIGEPFRDGDAVIMDLTDLDAADAKRVVDFAAGLCFALRGSMQNLAKGTGSRRRVFAIIPENARITTAELKRAARLD